jgi:hypothetical protein
MRKIKAIIRLMFLLTEATIACFRFILLSDREIVSIQWEDRIIRKSRKPKKQKAVSYLKKLYKEN